MIVEALERLHSRIDGEAVACDDNGVASFDLIRHHRANDGVFLYAFDLIELNGDDLRRDPLEVRKATLASVLAKAGPGIRFNERIEGDGPTVFAHACKLGLEGIVSKRKDSPYRSGRSPDGLKMKNSDAPKAILIWEEVMPTLVGFGAFAALPEEQIREQISRRILSGDQGMIVWWSIGAGVHVEPHNHANEQIVWMLKGKMEFRLGSEQRVCGQGDVIVIPGGTEHEAWFREECRPAHPHSVMPGGGAPFLDIMAV